MKKRVAAIIVAAGSSSRMGAVCKDKLFLKINGTQVLARTMIQYEKADSIDQIYVVTRNEMQDEVRNLAERYHISKFAGVTAGGTTRQLSVRNGISLCAGADYIAIADGARPFTKPEDIDRVTSAAMEHKGAILCVPVKDTIKVLGDQFIKSTPPRNTLLSAQTPQTFERTLFERLMLRALEEDKNVTDDSSIFEMYGESVMPVIGDYDNIKITTAEDILQAEAIAGKESK